MERVLKFWVKKFGKKNWILGPRKFFMNTIMGYLLEEKRGKEGL
jgi:hypothetical protein